MSQNLPLIMKHGSPDDFQTPPIALSPLLPFIPKDWIVWETACGNGNLVKELKNQGYQVENGDIKSGKDYFTYELEKQDCSITNPPFSKKNEWIKRTYELGKPFALLLPLAALETQTRQRQWKKGLQLIVLDKRLHFETPNHAESHCWFASAWFTNGLNLPKDIMFSELKELNQLELPRGSVYA